MNIPDKFWKSLMGVLGLLTIFLAIVSISWVKGIFNLGANPNITNSIMVTGKGEVVTVPDVATFSFTVTETARTVEEAQKLATAKINNVLKAVKDAGVDEKDIKTQSYYINPHYEYQNSVCTTYSCPPSKSILTGFDVGQNILVKVRDLKKAGELFSTIGSYGVQNLGDLSFSVDEPEGLKAEARAKAIADAKSKAKILAKQLGVSLVGVISYSDNDNNYPMPLYGRGGGEVMMAKSDAATPEVPSGEQKIISNVTVTYEIR